MKNYSLIPFLVKPLVPSQTRDCFKRVTGGLLSPSLQGQMFTSKKGYDKIHNLSTVHPIYEIMLSTECELFVRHGRQK